ncbi:MAG TPA: tetratricopeptide repeat protein [Stellaceae bacterium]|nr:tetratricopeptide repeat protein [Stellaceae bacterium]
MSGPGSPGQQVLSLPQALALAERYRSEGRLDLAEGVCRQVLRVVPNHAETLHLLGIILHQAGHAGAAIDLLKQAIAVEGRIPLYHCNLGEMCRLAGRFDEAVAAGRQALALKPDYPEALNNLGIAHYDRGEFDLAIDHYRRAVAIAPSYAEAHSNLGNGFRAKKLYEEALPHYRRAIQLKPRYADAYNNMGTALRDLKRIAESETTYRQALALNPNDPLTLNNLALAVKDLDRIDEALEILARSAAINPNNHQTFTYLASSLNEQHRTAEARVAIERALTLRPDDPDATNILGNVLFEEGDTDGALASFEKAIAAKPDLSDAYNNMGNALKELGRFEAAKASYVKAIELDPKLTGAYLNLADAKKFTPEDPHLAAMEAMLGEMSAMPDTDQLHIHFALGKAYADLERHEDSFRHMLKGNALKRAKITYDETQNAALLREVKAVFTPELMRQKRGQGDPSPLPLFVLGMPRSGTTLVEQILASHPRIFGAGELRDFHVQVYSWKSDASFPGLVKGMSASDLRRFGETYLAGVKKLAPEALRITDKMPSNFYYVGLIHLALPHARIIHTRRNPVDTCLSCFSKLFSGEQNHTYDLAELGRYYRFYEALMDHWRRVLPPGVMLEVQYEEVVADLETNAKAIIAHAGLPWDEACLAFHKNERPIRTASATQVRRPIYQSSIGRWRPYKDMLEPLLRELGVEA